MRLCTYRSGGATRLGRVEGTMVQPLAGRDVADALAQVPASDGPAVPLAGLALEAPLHPRTAFAVGRNYRLHAAELGGEAPRAPQVFMKHRECITAPSGPVVHPGPGYTGQLDYECELAAVIGSRADRVPPARALEHIFGYCILDDVSARDLQGTEPQWLRAKGGPTFGPLGPWVTTADEIPDPQALRQRTWVNRELRQDASTADMVFGVAEVIAWLSASVPLLPGDLLAMGTPAGVGLGMEPPRFLWPGDVVRMEIDGLGAIEHRIVERGAA
jgi:acylpyruvate hydrolase